jgi:hypothetical protein
MSGRVGIAHHCGGGQSPAVGNAHPTAEWVGWAMPTINAAVGNPLRWALPTLRLPPMMFT